MCCGVTERNTASLNGATATNEMLRVIGMDAGSDTETHAAIMHGGGAGCRSGAAVVRWRAVARAAAAVPAGRGRRGHRRTDRGRSDPQHSHQGREREDPAEDGVHQVTWS